MSFGELSDAMFTTVICSTRKLHSARTVVYGRQIVKKKYNIYYYYIVVSALDTMFGAFRVDT